MRVWRLDESNKLDLYSYGIFNFPRTVSPEFKKVINTLYFPKITLTLIVRLPQNRMRDVDPLGELEIHCPEHIHGKLAEADQYRTDPGVQ